MVYIHYIYCILYILYIYIHTISGNHYNTQSWCISFCYRWCVVQSATVGHQVLCILWMVRIRTAPSGAASRESWQKGKQVRAQRCVHCASQVIPGVSLIACTLIGLLRKLREASRFERACRGSAWTADRKPRKSFRRKSQCKIFSVW